MNNVIISGLLSGQSSRMTYVDLASNRPLSSQSHDLSCTHSNTLFFVAILKDFENASLVLLLLTLRIHDISVKIFLN